MLTALSDHSMLPFQWGAVLGASLVAAATDLSTRRIPNWLTGSVLLGGMIWALGVAGWSGLADSLAGVILLALPFVLLFVFAGGGAGDAKLMAALGAWLGFGAGVTALLCVALAGGVMALLVALAKRRCLATLANLQLLAFKLFVLFKSGQWKSASAVLGETSPMQTMPYGVAIFAGVCIAAGVTLLWPS